MKRMQIPLVTSPYVLWTAVTLLALYAIWIGRRRRRTRRRKWEEEELPEPPLATEDQ